MGNKKYHGKQQNKNMKVVVLSTLFSVAYAFSPSSRATFQTARLMSDTAIPEDASEDVEPTVPPVRPSTAGSRTILFHVTASLEP